MISSIKKILTLSFLVMVVSILGVQADSPASQTTVINGTVSGTQATPLSATLPALPAFLPSAPQDPYLNGVTPDFQPSGSNGKYLNGVSSTFAPSGEINLV